MCQSDSFKFRDYIYEHTNFCLQRKYDIFQLPASANYKALTHWTSKENDYLKKSYKKVDMVTISKDLDRTVYSVYQQARKLKLSKPHRVNVPT